MKEREPITQSVETPKDLEKFYLKEGLNAIVMPDLGNRTELHEPSIPHVDEAIIHLQAFLDEIDRQNGEIVAVVPLTALQRTVGHLPIWNEPEHIQWIQEQKYIFIIKKSGPAVSTE